MFLPGFGEWIAKRIVFVQQQPMVVEDVVYGAVYFCGTFLDKKHFNSIYRRQTDIYLRAYQLTETGWTEHLLSINEIDGKESVFPEKNVNAFLELLQGQISDVVRRSDPNTRPEFEHVYYSDEWVERMRKYISNKVRFFSLFSKWMGWIDVM